MHNYGYLVLLSDGTETNIGNKCGKKHFGTDFEDSKKIINQLKTEKIHLEMVSNFIKDAANNEKIIIKLQAGMKENPSLAKICNLVYAMTQNVEPLGSELTRKIQIMLEEDGTIKKEIRKSKEEIEMEKAAGGKKISEYRTEIVGKVTGRSILKKHKEIMGIRSYFQEIFTATVGKNAHEMTKTKRRTISKKIGEYKEWCQKLTEVMEAGEKFMKEENFILIKSQLTTWEIARVETLWNRYCK